MLEPPRQDSPEFDLSPPTEAQKRFVEIFSEYARMALLPKSVGAIYGLLYGTDKPLAVPEIIAKLEVSKATVSQSMRLLHDLRAVSVTKRGGVRHDFFSAETSLRKIVGTLIRERVIPAVKEREARIHELEEVLLHPGQDKKERSFLEARINTLKQWMRRTKLLLPFIQRGVNSKE